MRHPLRRINRCVVQSTRITEIARVSSSNWCDGMQGMPRIQPDLSLQQPQPRLYDTPLLTTCSTAYA